MFCKKRIELLEKQISKLENLKVKIESCEICKCLIRKEDAIKGKSEVRHKVVGYAHVFSTRITTDGDEYIFTPYYCLRCKPKK